MKKLVLVLVVAALVVASSVFSVAQDQPAVAPAGPGPMVQRMGSVPCVANSMRPFGIAIFDSLAQRLQLTDEQKPKVRELLTKADEALKTKIDANRKATEAFLNNVRNNADEATLQASGKAATAAESDVLDQKIKNFVALRDLLTDQQKAELVKMVQMGPMMRNPFSGGPSGDRPANAPVPPPAP